MQRTVTILGTSALVLVLAACAPGSTSSSTHSIKNCFETAHGVICASPGTSDADGDGVPDTFVCADGDDDNGDGEVGDSGGDSGGDNDDDNMCGGGDDGADSLSEDSVSDSGSDDGGDSSASDSGDDSGADDGEADDKPAGARDGGDSDSDGVPDGVDCDCGGNGGDPLPPTDPPPDGTPIP